MRDADAAILLAGEHHVAIGHLRMHAREPDGDGREGKAEVLRHEAYGA